MNRLQPYPFERLRQLFADATPPAACNPISLSIGEPKHPTPSFILEAFANAGRGLSNYPTTIGPPALREAIARWLTSRHALAALDPALQVLPVLGSREALFAFAQTVVDASRVSAAVVMPNPFYQIYEGAAILAGAAPHYINGVAEENSGPGWKQLSDAVWNRTQLIYVCSPDNPTGKVMSMDDWRQLFELADRFDFVIAADECYSEIYFDEENPPLGSLRAAQELGRADYRRLVSFGSLSKRSNCPGLRSGYVAGDASLIRAFLLYRTYHGSAMSQATAAASIAAWSDEAHVRDNRAKYGQKFDLLTEKVNALLPTVRPQAGFYLWAGTPIADQDFARRLYASQGVSVLPGSYLAREAHGENPGRDYIRLALVAPLDECVEAIDRLITFARTL